MRRANAKHWRVRTEGNIRQPTGACELGSHAFRAKRRTHPRAKAQLSLDSGSFVGLAGFFDAVANDARERLVAFGIVVLVVHAGLSGDLLSDLGATLFGVFFHVS